MSPNVAECPVNVLPVLSIFIATVSGAGAEPPNTFPPSVIVMFNVLLGWSKTVATDIVPLEPKVVLLQVPEYFPVNSDATTGGVGGGGGIDGVGGGEPELVVEPLQAARARVASPARASDRAVMAPALYGLQERSEPKRGRFEAEEAGVAQRPDPIAKSASAGIEGGGGERDAPLP